MPESLHLRPHAKINIGLFITGKRADGYHNLQTLFYPAPLHDALVLTPIVGDTPTLDVGGIALAGDVQQNLCLRAWQALRQLVPTLPAVHIKLDKHIPAGAGLGGGSSDAAFTLRGLVQLFDLVISKPVLHQLAVQLGADVPFFLYDEPMLATGIGDVLTPFALDLSYRIQLVTPNVVSNTVEAYRGLDISQCTTNKDLAQLLQLPIAQWRDAVVNDFEPSVFARYPMLAVLKQELYAQGAVYASMSGSGSALYGLFPQK